MSIASDVTCLSCFNVFDIEGYSWKDSLSWDAICIGRGDMDGEVISGLVRC